MKQLLNDKDLKDFLNQKVQQYNQPQFIESDPIQIPHLFSKKEDIEIAGFLAATIAWGNRKSIIKNAKRMMELLDQYQRLEIALKLKRGKMNKAKLFVKIGRKATDL